VVFLERESLRERRIFSVVRGFIIRIERKIAAGNAFLAASASSRIKRMHVVIVEVNIALDGFMQIIKGRVVEHFELYNPPESVS
jgi:predicted phosphoribosyltransferase